MIEVDLVISSTQPVDPVRWDQHARKLAADIRREARIAVDVAAGDAQPGAKSGAGLEVGRLVLAGVFSAATVQAVASVLRSYFQQRKESVFELSRGDLKLVAKGTRSDVDAALARLPELLGTTDPGD